MAEVDTPAEGVKFSSGCIARGEFVGRLSNITFTVKALKYSDNEPDISETIKKILLCLLVKSIHFTSALCYMLLNIHFHTW